MSRQPSIPSIPDPTATAPPWAPYALDGLDLDADTGTMDATPAPVEPTTAPEFSHPDRPVQVPVYLLAGGLGMVVGGFVLVGLGAGALVVLLAVLLS